MATPPLCVRNTIALAAPLYQSCTWRSFSTLAHACTWRRSWKRARRFFIRMNATEESAGTQYSIDKDKAREALGNLDKQLQALSQKQDVAPKKKASDLSSAATAAAASPSGLPDSIGDANEMPELSGSLLAYSAVALIAITVINNLIFILLIKPAVDGNNMVAPPEITREGSNNVVTRQIYPPLREVD